MIATRSGARRRVSPLIALTATAGIVLAGCATDEPVGPDPLPAPAPVPAPTAEPDATGDADGIAQPEAVSWTGSVCRTLIPVAQTLRTPPPVDVTAPEAAQQAYRDYLTEAQNQAEQAQQEIGALGAPPVEGGEELAQEVQEQITDLREDAAEAREQIDAATPGDPVSIGQAVVAGANVLGAMGNNVQALATLTADPELRNAVEQAPECAELRTIGDPT